MSRGRTTTVAGAALAAIVLLGGCSEDEEQYCQVLAEEQETLTGLADDSAAGKDVLGPTLESFERLRDAAPDELEDEWDTLSAAYEAVVDAVERAGIDPAEFRPDDLPKGLPGSEARRLASVASKLASTRVTEAAAGIQDHADAVCDVAFTG